MLERGDVRSSSMAIKAVGRTATDGGAGCARISSKRHPGIWAGTSKLTMGRLRSHCEGLREGDGAAWERVVALCRLRSG